MPGDTVFQVDAVRRGDGARVLLEVTGGDVNEAMGRVDGGVYLIRDIRRAQPEPPAEDATHGDDADGLLEVELLAAAAHDRIDALQRAVRLHTLATTALGVAVLVLLLIAAV